MLIGVSALALTTITPTVEYAVTTKIELTITNCNNWLAFLCAR